MATRSHPHRDATSLLDRAAIGLSTLCVVHCLATVLLAATLATASAALANPLWHEAGFALAMLLGALALGRGFARHRRRAPLAIGIVGLALMAAGIALPDGRGELVATLSGVALLAVAHLRNGRHGHLAGDRRHA